MQVTLNGTVSYTKYYAGNLYEEKVDASGNITAYNYVYIDGKIAGLYIDKPSGATDVGYYVHTDYSGSVVALSSQSGSVMEKYAYDAWGRRRNPDNWSQPDTRTSLIIERGYTGHEHLDAFELINMNGRVYDPAAGMFLSPDPVLQNPGDPLNYNRYSYVLNNPLKYTDPSGYQPHPMQRKPKGWEDLLGGGGSAVHWEFAFHDGIVSYAGWSGSPGASSGFAPGSCGYKYLDNGTYFDVATGKTVSANKAIDWATNKTSSRGSSNNYIYTSSNLPSSARKISSLIFSGTWENRYQRFLGFNYTDGTSLYLTDIVPVQGGAYSLYFDGNRLMVVNENTGNVDYSTIATSGKGEHMNNPASQSIQNLGPIPQGNYTINNTKWSQQSTLRQMYNIVAGNGDWGDYNVPLIPTTYQGPRNSFYLHGGFFEGSAGCIDAGQNVGNIYNIINTQSVTILRVRYQFM